MSVECVNVCKLAKGDVGGRYDCNALSCAWKAPRVLSGFLASTAHPPQCWSSPIVQAGRRDRGKSVSVYADDAVVFVFSGLKRFVH